MRGMRKSSTAFTKGNTEVLERANMRSMYTILCERRLRWVGHVKRMDRGRLPKDLLYGELAEGLRHAGRPKLHFKDVCDATLIVTHGKALLMIAHLGDKLSSKVQSLQKRH